MADYIDRDKVLDYQETVITDDYSGNDILDVVLVDEILGVRPADVVEREEINKVIEEIKNIDTVYSATDDRTQVLKNCDDIKAEVIEILKRI